MCLRRRTQCCDFLDAVGYEEIAREFGKVHEMYPTVTETLEAILAAIGRGPQITSQLGQSLCGLNEYLGVRSLA